jgi:trimethylamine--corrinoid protein Co-methyltransferase
VCASEVPAGIRPLHEFFAMLTHCSKHGQHELHRPEQVPYLIEGLTAVMGSEQAVRERHAFSLIYCPVAPLMHDGPMLDAYLDLGRIDMPVMIMPMPVTGTTGPASLFSNLCVANAEALSSIVIFQLAHPGRPLIYSSATGTIDFRSGAYLGGTPEMGLMSAALVEMGRFYNLPASSAGCTSDAKQPGVEAVLEKFLTTLPPAMAGSDVIVGFGELESDQLLVLEQIVVDNEIAQFCERIVTGVETGEGKNHLEDVIKLGPGGNYLSVSSTRTAARSDEFFTPRLLDRHSLEAWTSLGKPSMYARARQRVQEILDGPVIDPLPENVVQILDNILAAAARAIPG